MYKIKPYLGKLMRKRTYRSPWSIRIPFLGKPATIPKEMLETESQ